MKVRSFVVLGLIVLFLIAAFFASRYFQKIIRPRESLSRFFIYLLSCLLLIFAISFLMVFITTRLFPDELMK